jgi:Mrp family chromosome partitioning ATPase
MVEMSEENCTHDCSSCGEDCPSRKTNPEDFLEKPNSMSKIGKVIGVVSGKGGVGKSMVTSMLAVLLSRRGSHTAVLDADVTGPSIPKAFGLKQKAMGSELGLLPVRTSTGIDVMSANLLLDDETAPVIWRGPMIANMVKQFWTDVIWNDVDYLFVDMPPGTGDVPLTVFQSIPLDGILIVTSPQELVSMIVAKAVNMAKMMNVPIIGIIENMSYVKCPDCGKVIQVFGESHVDEIAAKFGLKVLGKCPFDPDLAKNFDVGLAELANAAYLDPAADAVEQFEKPSKSE